MKKLLLLLVSILVISCKSQGTISNVNDKQISEKIINQFSQKFNFDKTNSVFAFFVQENPEINEVKNKETSTVIHNGFSITVYKFEYKEQVYEFVQDYNIYNPTSSNFYIFNKKSDPNFLRILKKNIVKTEIQSTDIGYDPKSWQLMFDSNGLLQKCNPIDCN